MRTTAEIECRSTVHVFLLPNEIIFDSDSIKPVCLPPTSPPINPGDPLVVTGWGVLQERGKAWRWPHVGYNNMAGNESRGKSN